MFRTWYFLVPMKVLFWKVAWLSWLWPEAHTQCSAKARRSEVKLRLNGIFLNTYTYIMLTKLP